MNNNQKKYFFCDIALEKDRDVMTVACGPGISKLEEKDLVEAMELIHKKVFYEKRKITIPINDFDKYEFARCPDFGVEFRKHEEFLTHDEKIERARERQLLKIKTSVMSKDFAKFMSHYVDQAIEGGIKSIFNQHPYIKNIGVDYA